MKTTLLPTIVAATIALLAVPAQAQRSEPKDYSKNSVTGEYRQLRTSSLAGTTSATAPAPPAPRSAAPAEGFSWGAAAIGAGAGFLFAFAGSALVMAVRRPAHS